ncbi:hypothetical protein GCM10027589_04730 [Actinocorallia lasiicapitis]
MTSQMLERRQLQVEPKWSLLRALAERRLLSLVAATAVGLTVLAVTDRLSVPLRPIRTLQGAIASKADYLDDPEVRRLLLGHNLRVVLTKTGSREIPLYGTERYDFAFPSGRPYGLKLVQHLRANRMRAEEYRPFVSPLVLGSFRAFAKALTRAGVAEPVGGTADTALYFTLDMGGYLDLVGRRTSWKGLDGSLNNNGWIAARTSDLCTSNGSITYLGLVAYVRQRNQVTGPADAEAVAEKIRGLMQVDALADDDLFLNYKSPSGPSIAPIVAIYEHQYLALQLERRAAGKEIDRDRVLLYPNPQIVTQPELISLRDGSGADELGRLLQTDEPLRRRAVELGFRLLDKQAFGEEPELDALLTRRGIPLPPFRDLRSDKTPGGRAEADETIADLPSADILETMIGKLLPACRRLP